MSLDSSNALADLIKRIADGVTVDVKPMRNTWYKVTVTYKDQTLSFNFDQGGKVPDAADAISALWSRAALIDHGDYRFYRVFYDKAFKESIEGGDALKPEYVAHYEEWKRCAEESWRVFGDWFGRRWE